MGEFHTKVYSIHQKLQAKILQKFSIIRIYQAKITGRDIAKLSRGQSYKKIKNKNNRQKYYKIPQR